MICSLEVASTTCFWTCKLLEVDFVILKALKLLLDVKTIFVLNETFTSNK